MVCGVATIGNKEDGTIRIIGGQQIGRHGEGQDFFGDVDGLSAREIIHGLIGNICFEV